MVNTYHMAKGLTEPEFTVGCKFSYKGGGKNCINISISSPLNFISPLPSVPLAWKGTLLSLTIHIRRKGRQRPGFLHPCSLTVLWIVRWSHLNRLPGTTTWKKKKKIKKKSLLSLPSASVLWNEILYLSEYFPLNTPLIKIINCIKFLLGLSEAFNQCSHIARLICNLKIILHYLSQLYDTCL